MKPRPRTKPRRTILAIFIVDCPFRASTDDGILVILHLSWYKKAMDSQDKTCQSCRQSFTIEPEDFSFYERIKVPPPTWCPECRMVRRLTWRHNRTIHKITCAKCGIEVFSIYHPSSKFPLYCSTCWWSDTWDAWEYAMEVDFTKPFLSQFQTLRER